MVRLKEILTAAAHEQGFVLVGSAEGSYNDLNGAINSRYSALVSDTFMNGTLGLLFAGGFQTRNLLTLRLDLASLLSSGSVRTGTCAYAGRGSPRSCCK